MKGLFIISIGQDDAGNYGAKTVSMADGTTNHCTAKRLPTLLKTIGARIAKRQVHNRKFPPPERSVIIKPNGLQAPTLIVPARN